MVLVSGGALLPGARAAVHAPDAFLMGRPRRYKNMQERIIANSVISTEHFFGGTPCWDWLGQFGTGGGGIKYPQMSTRVDGKHTTVRAHRVSYEEFTGDALGGNDCNHLCERPMCVAPLHLESVTRQENIAYRDRRKAA